MKFDDPNIYRNYSDIHHELCMTIAGLETDLKIIVNQYERAKEKYHEASVLLARRIADYEPTQPDEELIDTGSAQFAIARDNAVEIAALRKLQGAREGDLIEANGTVWKLQLAFSTFQDAVGGFYHHTIKKQLEKRIRELEEELEKKK